MFLQRRRILCGIVGMLLTYCAFTPALHRRLIDKRIFLSHVLREDALVLNHDYEAIHHQFQSSNGSLHGWMYRRKSPNFSSKDLTVLYCHGATRNALSRAPIAARILQAGAGAVFVFDPAGFGLSEGTASIKSFSDSSRDAFQYIATSIEPERVVIWGESLGSGAAVLLASEVKCAALVVAAGFDSLQSLVATKFWPFKIYPGACFGPQFNNVDKIKGVASRILIVHGRLDRVIRVQRAVRLQQAAPLGTKLVVLPNSAHVIFADDDQLLFVQTLTEFFNQIVGTND